LSAEKIALWDGHAYAVEVVEHLGLANRGGVIRAGVVRYIENDDVDRLLNAIERCCHSKK
jgi:selenocysteine lyase/cysteine desulfurase